MDTADSVLNNRYKLLQRSGTGGMATVYKGQDLMLGRLVAIKVLHQNLTGDDEFLRRFQQEAHAAANLAHPNIVTVHDIGQDRQHYYIVMEFVEGWTLKDVIRRHLDETGRPLPVAYALDLAIQICAGIGYAHRADLIHCDVKSQNVLVTRDNRVKVADFGIARALSEVSLQDDDVLWGTPQYFSPEQAAGKTPTPASDVYSIGVIMFEMFTGRLPFKAESHTAVASKHMYEPPPPITSLNPTVPAQLEQIISKVLSKEPTGRYRTADQLGRVLKSYRQGSMQETGPFIGIEPTSARMSEQETAFFSLGVQEMAAQSLEPAQSSLPLAEQAEDIYLPALDAADNQGTDWTAVSLGVLALISLLGLIPLWYLVFLRYTGQ